MTGGADLGQPQPAATPHNAQGQPTVGPVVSNDRRDQIAEAIAVALLLIYQGSARETLSRLGAPGGVQLPHDADGRIMDFARYRAQLVQEGINTYVEDAVARLPADATAQQIQQVVDTELADAQNHHTATLIPFLASWAYHQGAFDAVDSLDSQYPPDLPRPQFNDRGQRLWNWNQNTGFTDRCTHAMVQSPDTRENLEATAGGPAPVHPNCQCTETPA